MKILRLQEFCDGFEEDQQGVEGPPERPSRFMQCWFVIIRTCPIGLIVSIPIILLSGLMGFMSIILICNTPKKVSSTLEDELLAWRVWIIKELMAAKSHIGSLLGETQDFKSDFREF